MPGLTQTLDISPVGRVGGDLDVRVEVAGGQVVNAWTQAELFRGLEVILRGKDSQAGPIVTPRACGICGASHLNLPPPWALDTTHGRPRCRVMPFWHRNLGQIVRIAAKPGAASLRSVYDRLHQQEILEIAILRRGGAALGSLYRDQL